jgi:hypothetical protein
VKYHEPLVGPFVATLDALVTSVQGPPLWGVVSSADAEDAPSTDDVWSTLPVWPTIATLVESPVSIPEERPNEVGVLLPSISVMISQSETDYG